MADQQFRALSSCVVIALLFVIVTAQNNVPEEGKWNFWVFISLWSIVSQNDTGKQTQTVDMLTLLRLPTCTAIAS